MLVKTTHWCSGKVSTSPWSFSAGTSHITKTRTSGWVGTSNGPQAWMPVRMVAYVLISLCDPVMNWQLVHKDGQVFPLGEAGRVSSSRLVRPLLLPAEAQDIVMVGLQNKDPSSLPWLEISWNFIWLYTKCCATIAGTSARKLCCLFVASCNETQCKASRHWEMVED